MAEPPVSLPVELKGVPRPVLERYVFERIRQFSRIFTSRLLTPEHPGVVPADQAFNETLLILGSAQQHAAQAFSLRFSHRCRFLACMDKECSLCSNNPEKRCSASDNFDECFADNQTLKSKCKAEVSVEAFFSNPSASSTLPAGVQVQLFVIDGDSCPDDVAPNPDTFRQLLKSDEGQSLLAASGAGIQDDGFGRILMALQGGSCRLPDVSITDKVDTFRSQGQTFSSFRLVAQAVEQDFAGRMSVMQHVAPAVSPKFVVKTQRALNDFSKPAYPHFKDRLTRLKFIGGVTADRLRDIQTHMPGVPFSSIETVEQLRQLMVFTDQHRQMEGKLLDVLSMKGRHKHKWDYLRDVLQQRIVYDDVMHRAWFAAEGGGQGVLFACKQGLVLMDKPFGLVERVVVDGQPQLRVFPARSQERSELMRQWKAMAEESWLMPGHPGWTVVAEPMELVDGSMGQQAAASGAREPADPMEVMESPFAYEGSSSPGAGLYAWQGGEPPSHSSRGSLPGLPMPSAASPSGAHPYSPRRMAAAAAAELPPTSPSSHAYSPRRMAAAGGAADAPPAGAFHFTAQRAIGEAKPARLLTPPALGSGSFSNHPDVVQLSGPQSGETSPFANTPVYSNPYSSPQTGPGSQGGGGGGTGSPAGSPHRPVSPHLERVVLPPRALSFTHQTHQRQRQVSSSAECTPARPGLLAGSGSGAGGSPASPSLLSVFARTKQEPGLLAARQQQLQQQHLAAGRQDQAQPCRDGSWSGFESGLEAVTSTKRRRASLPDYSGAYAAAMQEAMQEAHVERGGSEQMLMPAPMRYAQQQHLQQQQQHLQQQQQQQWQQSRLAYSPPEAREVSDGGISGGGGLDLSQGVMQRPDRFSDGMMSAGDTRGDLDSPHLLAAIEQHLHLSDHGPGTRRGLLFQDPALGGPQGQRGLDLNLNLSGGGGGGGGRGGYAPSASLPSAASGHSALQRGLNLAMDTAAAPCHSSFSPSSASLPSASQPSAASGHSAMQRGGLGLHLGGPPLSGGGGHEAASAFVADSMAAPGAGIELDANQIDRWFDQSQVMVPGGFGSTAPAPAGPGAVGMELLDKQMSHMMERSGSFNQLLDSMLNASSCELPDIVP